MVKHIVLFKLKEFASEDEKARKLHQIQLGLLNLKSIIKELQTIEVGLNKNPKEQYDIALTTTHLTMEDLHAYAVHPEHLAVSKIIREVLESRSCVDYNI
ncbi:MAG: Dabb family protein [Paludibacteraceae bacterium]|nr:Dabb family protein [Paludibacteraceae bacterium]